MQRLGATRYIEISGFRCPKQKKCRTTRWTWFPAQWERDMFLTRAVVAQRRAPDCALPRTQDCPWTPTHVLSCLRVDTLVRDCYGDLRLACTLRQRVRTLSIFRVFQKRTLPGQAWMHHLQRGREAELFGGGVVAPDANGGVSPAAEEHVGARRQRVHLPLHSQRQPGSGGAAASEASQASLKSACRGFRYAHRPNWIGYQATI